MHSLWPSDGETEWMVYEAGVGFAPAESTFRIDIKPPALLAIQDSICYNFVFRVS